MSKQIINGGFQNPLGGALTGNLLLILSQDAKVAASSNQVAPLSVRIPISGGNIAATLIYFNDELLPGNTYYTMTAYDSAGNKTYGPEQVSFTGAGPLDLGTLTPLLISPDPLFSNPVLQNPVLAQAVVQPAGTNLTIGNLNGRCEIDGVKYKTLAAAFADSNCKIIDDRAFLSGGVISSTITFPAYPVALYLACQNNGGTAIYNGPSSGPMFVINAPGSSGSSIEGCGMVTSAGQADYHGNGTQLLAHSGNASDLIDILQGSGATIQGIRIENLVLDGNGNVNDLLHLDATKVSYFHNISYNNCGIGIHTTVTNALSNQGVQENIFDGIFGGGCSQLILLDGNSGGTSTTTLNIFRGINATFNCTTCAGIEIKQGDGNSFFEVKQLFPTQAASFTGDCIKLDAPAAPLEGALFNFFFALHVGCGTGADNGNSFHVGANTYGNQVYGFNAIENQRQPVVDSGAIFDFDIARANQTSWFSLDTNKALGWTAIGGNTPDTAFLRAGVGRLTLSTGYNNNAQGELDMGTMGLVGSSNFGKVGFTAPATVTTYTQTEPAAAPTVANAIKQYTTGAVASFSTSPGALTIASGTATMTTAAIAAGACGATVTVAAAGVATTDSIEVSFNAAPAGTNAGLVSWPTSGNVNFAYCPGVAETPAAATINWRVVR